MAATSDFSRSGRIYLGAVIVGGLAVVAASVRHFYQDPIGYEWFLLAALTLISGSASVRLPGSSARISISETFVFTAVLLYGPAAGALIVALDGLVISFWIAKRRREPSRVLFNMSAPALSAWCSANLFFYVAGIEPLVRQPATLDRILPALVLFALTYFGLNSWLIAFVIAFEKRVSAFKIWRESLLWLSLNYFCGASVAVLIVVYNRSISLGYLGVIVPLLLVLYFTFKTAMARVEDASSHLAQLNKLYLSTIETLAMAIDAKDQITHGHIRRVQTYAVGLARRVGVKDESLIRAIEAAALLHDMGKLAVPEYILNKPGKLSTAEFEKMKLHAAVGADILSAIDFPYPVVPIVRHHHENWDGTGYPVGLKGTDIPIGARILSVVDCYDALTSDRPYRPRLSADEAMAILFQRRGTMYDPLVVDTFAEVHDELVDESTASNDVAALDEIVDSIKPAGTSSTSTPAALDDIASSSDEMLTLYELAAALAGQTSIGDTGDVIAKHLRRLVPFSLCVLYLYDPSTDELVARHTVGDAMPALRGLRITLGQRLSGWVAANRQTIVNSDPSLDLGEMARGATPRLKSCLSSPLVSNGQLVGVLTLYSPTQAAYTDDHRRVLEAVAHQTAHTFRCAAELDDSSDRDELTGLPTLRKLESLINRQVGQRSSLPDQPRLLLLDIVRFRQLNDRYGRAVGDEVLRHVARHARSGLRTADILFRYRSDEFIALLSEADEHTAAQVAARVQASLQQQPVTMRDGSALYVEVQWREIAPQRTSRLDEAISTARRDIAIRASRVH
jgi:diguanylate cyclase (GGDEF)-like protein/putative nucleotidyltransferase with HDIG domain